MEVLPAEGYKDAQSTVTLFDTCAKRFESILILPHPPVQKQRRAHRAQLDLAEVPKLIDTRPYLKPNT